MFSTKKAISITLSNIVYFSMWRRDSVFHYLKFTWCKYWNQRDWWLPNDIFGLMTLQRGVCAWHQSNTIYYPRYLWMCPVRVNHVLMYRKYTLVTIRENTWIGKATHIAEISVWLTCPIPHVDNLCLLYVDLYVWDAVSMLTTSLGCFVHGFCFSNNGLNKLPWTSLTCYTKDNQQGRFRLSKRFYLRRLRPWTYHLPPAW